MCRGNPISSSLHSYSRLVLKHANVNLQRLFNNQDVKTLFPSNDKFYLVPSLSYRYSKSIRSDIVNYRATIEDPDYNNFVCSCDQYPTNFKDPYHGHIYTGDMNIIKHKGLRTIMSKGLGFHEQQPPNKNIAYNCIESRIDRYINSTSNKLSLPVPSFSPWKREVLKRVRARLNEMKTYKFNQTLKQIEVKNELTKLKKDFVLIPVDKAAKNISIICKKYYMTVLSDEIEHSDTFEEISDNKDQFVKTLKTRYPGKLPNEKLPYLYATAKMHKNPTNFRFITAGNNTAFSKISIDVMKCLKLLLNTARSSMSYKIKEIDNCIFVIDNRDKVVDFINSSNQQSNDRREVTTWDFSTLYTKIPHNKLKDKMASFVKKLYNCVKHSSKAANFICCSDKSNTAYFSKSRSNDNISLDSDELCNLINVVIDNSYIVYHGIVYRQVIGIPMGTNCAPFLANIFLHVYEYEYLQLLINQGHVVEAKKLAHTFRYQDDCAAINDGSTFKKHFEKIYPPEMVLKNTNISTCVSTFLDLRISVFRGKFRYVSYDKRNDFDFVISNYPHLNGNIPYSAAYGVYMSQLVRFCDINSDAKSFSKDVKAMSKKFLNQGFDKKGLSNTFSKFRTKYLYKWSKYGIDINDFKSF